jgi:hypothetical protein
LGYHQHLPDSYATATQAAAEHAEHTVSGAGLRASALAGAEAGLQQGGNPASVLRHPHQNSATGQVAKIKADLQVFGEHRVERRASALKRSSASNQVH